MFFEACGTGKKGGIAWQGSKRDQQNSEPPVVTKGQIFLGRGRGSWVNRGVSRGELKAPRLFGFAGKRMSKTKEDLTRFSKLEKGGRRRMLMMNGSFRQKGLKPAGRGGNLILRHLS